MKRTRHTFWLRALFLTALLLTLVAVALAATTTLAQEPPGFWFVRLLDEAELASLPAGALAFGPLEAVHGDQIYELDVAGQALRIRPMGSGPGISYSLPPLPVAEVEGMAVAPSNDPTDDPAQVSIYVSGDGRVLELVYQPPPLQQPAVTIVATLERTLDLSQLSPPSPDPAGITYKPGPGQLLISDSEVNETPHYSGVNTFYLNLAGNLVETNDTTDFSDEPTGIAYRETGNGRLYIADDDEEIVFVVCEGCPETEGDTEYVVLASFSTSDFGSEDPEGITYDTVEGHLFIVDGSGREVYDVDPGPDGMFGNDNDTVTNFDVASLGASDPEGIAFDVVNNRLLVLDSDDDQILIVSRDGALIDLIDISAANAVKPAGITLAPAGDGNGTNLYIVDRGIDNDDDPQENDGKLYEMSLPGPTPTPTSPPTSTPLPTDTPTPTITPLPTNTPTNTPIPTNTPLATSTATNTPVATDTPVPTHTPPPGITPSSTPTPNPSHTPTPAPPSATPPPVMTETPTPTATATSEVTETPGPPPPDGNVQFMPAFFNRPNTWGEPNDSCGEAHQVSVNVPRQFFAEDRDDWYRFTLFTEAEVTVHLSQFAPLAGQVAVYRGETCGTAEFLGNNGNFGTDKSVSLGEQPAGTYYIYVSNDGPLNNTDLYQLLIDAD